MNSIKNTGFSIKERLLMTLPPAIAIPAMIFIVGPMEAFAGNVSEFQFVLSDFILWNVLYTD